MSQLIHRFFPLAFLVLLGFECQAQCYGNAQAEAEVCSGTPISHSAYTQCPNCTYNWSGNPISGQGTGTATYIWNCNGAGHMYSYPTMSGYNPNANCGYQDMFQTTVGCQPIEPLPALVNGPWDGDTSKVWLYRRNRIQMFIPYYYTYTPTWSVTNGQITRTRTANVGPSGQIQEDSVWIKWHGGGPMVLQEARQTYHYGNYGWNFNCTWTPIQSSVTYPSLAIFHQNVCSGSPANYFTFPFPGSTYTWSTTSGSIVSGQGTNSAYITINGPATITVQRDSSGVITTTSTAVTPYVPVISLGPDYTFCQGSPATLTANSGFTSYLWSTGATTQSIVASTPGQYSVTASINGACTVSDTIVLGMHAVTRPNLGPDIHACVGGTTLDAGPGYTSYLWNTGATTQTITAPSFGSYRVTATDANGCASSDTVTVFLHQPTVDLGQNTTFCVPGNYTIYPTTTQATSFLWSTGATTSTLQVTSLGANNIWLQVSNTYGCTASDTIVLTGLPRPTPTLGPNQTVCPGTPVTLTPGGGYSGYLWSTISTQQSITVTTPGTYTVTVTDANGCQGSSSMVLSNYPLNQVNLGPDINVCQPSAILNAGAGYATYNWSNGATTQSITITQAGNYAVTVTTVNGCVSSDDINVIFSNFSFSLGPDQNVCEPAVVTLDPQLAGNFTYNWSTGANSPTLTMTAPTTAQQVILNASNNLGCANSDTVIVTILPTPPSLLGGDTLMCMDTTITLTLGPGFSTYQWSTGANTQSIVASSGGNYLVTATAPNGCTRLDTVNISQMIDCVFPGDVNYDGVADGLDVVALGTAYGVNGNLRPNASLQWYGQYTYNWAGSITTGANYKQGDTNGDGQINANDTLAIQQNFGQTHNKAGGIATGTEVFRFVPVNPAVQAGDIAEWDVYLEGLGQSGLDSIYGMELTLGWPSNLVTAMSYADMSSTWFAPAGNHLEITHVVGGQATLAITRTSQVDTSGHGRVMRIGLVTNPNMPVGQVSSLVPSVLSSNVLGMNLFPRVPQIQSTAMTVLGPVQVTPQVITHVSVWPMPAADVLHVFAEGLMPTEVQLVDMLGQVVKAYPWGDGEILDLPLGGIAAGNYCLKVQTTQGVLTKRIVVGR